MISDETVAKAHAEYHKVLGTSGRSDPMRAALEAVMPQWFSIDSAPKDGTHILVYGDYDPVCTAFYDTKAGGFWASTTGDCEELDFAPTGWCTIPALGPSI